ncbi:hypothetical protein H5410_040537 [Solanum commersonii]|uniref:Uncharacterized protein n=1 Tax=Solanum commersonii TaxID=4109 RepID=A0A9J5XR66_SOLCO|nr:hypothetical protein H5410_040537 [Solanum commersonii]
MCHWATWYCLAKLLGDAPTALFFRQLDPFLQGSAHWNKRRGRPFDYSLSGLGDPQAFIFFVLFSLFVPFCEKTQVQSFKKGVSNSATQDSIMDAHNKIQFTYAKIKCALKDSSYDSPISKNLTLTILASNASSSSTKVLECPNRKNDSVITQWFTV